MTEPALARRAKILRVRYAVRLLLVLLTITPLMALTRRYYASRAVRKQPHPNAALYWLVSVRVLTVGVALGIGWLVSHLLVPHHNDSVRLIAVRVVLLPVTIPVQIRFERRRQAAGIVRPLPIRSPRIIGAKLALVLAAFGAEWLLGKVTPDADLIVAVGVFVVVALLGPKVQHYYLTGRRRQALADSSQVAAPVAAGD